MKNIFHILAIAITFTLFCSNANAQEATLSYGVNNEIELFENTADQRVDIFASNIAGKDYDTFELFILMGDGGAPTGGTDTGPRLTGVELGAAGTVFEGGLRGDIDAGSQTDLLWADFIDSAVATSDGIVGTLIFDTTGFDAGATLAIQFESINLGGTPFNTNFRNLTEQENVAASSNGFIRVISAVPEPSSAIVLLAMTGLMGLRRRR